METTNVESLQGYFLMFLRRHFHLQMPSSQESVSFSYVSSRSHRPGPYDVHCVQAIRDVSASYDALVDLFESTENFLRRLDIYIEISPTTEMTEIIVKILVELLSTLALATQQVKQGRLSVSFSWLVHRSSLNVTREVRNEASRGEQD